MSFPNEIVVCVCVCGARAGVSGTAEDTKNMCPT